MSRERIRFNLDAFMKKNGVSMSEMCKIVDCPESTLSSIRSRGYVYEPEFIQTILDHSKDWNIVPLFAEVSADDIRYDAAIYRIMLKERDSKIVELTKRIAKLEHILDLSGINYRK